MLALKSSSTERSLCRLSMIYIFITLLQSLSFAIEDSSPLKNSGLKAVQTPRKSDTGLQSPTLMQIDDTAVCDVDVGCFKTTQNIEVKFRKTEDGTGVEFQIKCQTPGGWCSLGFGRNAKNMSPASVIDCLRFTNGNTDVRMSFNGPDRTENNVPLNDITLADYIKDITSSYVGDILTCNFVRLFDANGNTNNDRIYSLNTESYYLLLGKGLRMDQQTAQKVQHDDDPEMSANTVDVKFTPQSNPTDSLTSQSLQTDSFTSQSIPTSQPSSGINGVCGVDVGCFNSVEGVRLRYLKTSDGKSVEFLITCNVQTSGWCSVGFANDRDMSPASVLDCMLYSNEKGATVELSYNGPGKDNNRLPDPKKYITISNAEHNNGDLTCNFLRSIDVSGDNYGNKIFNLNTPYYLMLGKGTLADQTTGKKNRHGRDPEVSKDKRDVSFIPSGTETSHGVSTLPFLRAQGVLMIAAWVLLRNAMFPI